jgi:hypothetical protein
MEFNLQEQLAVEAKARDYAAQFPDLGLNPAHVALAWQKYPAAAAIDNGVKVARIKDIHKYLGRAGLSLTQLTQLVARNLKPIERPAQSFVEGYLQATEALDNLGLPAGWLVTAALREPEIAARPGIQLALGVVDSAIHFHKTPMGILKLAQALQKDPGLLLSITDSDGLARTKFLQSLGAIIAPEDKAEPTIEPEKKAAPPCTIATPLAPLLNLRERLKKKNILARARAADILPAQALLPDKALSTTLVKVHASIKRAKRIGTKGLGRVLTGVKTEEDLITLPARAKAALKRADAVKCELGSAGLYSFMVHAIANPALAEQAAKTTARNVEGLARILAPVGMTAERVTKMANRTPDYFLTTPEAAQAHIDEVCTYFAGKLDASTYIKTMGQESRCSFLPLTKPVGFATETLDWVRTTFEVGQDDLLKMVKYYPGILAKSPAELAEKVDNFSDKLKLTPLPADAAKKIIAADLTYLSRNTAEMGDRFVAIAHGLHPYGFNAANLLAAVCREPRVLFSRAEKTLENTQPVFRRLLTMKEPTELYTEALKAQPMLLLCGADYVWDNFLIIRQSSVDGFMSTARSKNRFNGSATAQAFSMPLALAFAPEQLALRRVWARTVKGGGAVNSFLKTSAKVVQAELLAKLGPKTDMAALAKDELESLAHQLGHSFNRQSAAPKPFCKKAKAEVTPA